MFPRASSTESGGGGAARAADVEADGSPPIPPPPAAAAADGAGDGEIGAASKAGTRPKPHAAPPGASAPCAVAGRSH